MVLQALDHVGRESFDAVRYAERAVVEMTSRAAGDLRQLGWREVAIYLPIELSGSGQRYVVDVEIQAHAYCVGGDEEIDVAVLEQCDLCVARAGAQSADHDGRTAALTANKFCQFIDFRGRKRDDRGTGRQARDFFSHRHR